VGYCHRYCLVGAAAGISLSDSTTDKHDFAPDVVSDAVSHDDDGGDGGYSALQDRRFLIAVYLISLRTSSDHPRRVTGARCSTSRSRSSWSAECAPLARFLLLSIWVSLRSSPNAHEQSMDARRGCTRRWYSASFPLPTTGLVSDKIRYVGHDAARGGFLMTEQRPCTSHRLGQGGVANRPRYRIVKGIRRTRSPTQGAMRYAYVSRTRWEYDL
jgi:hypothetical protein